jgi:MoxR-like ATPase
LPAPQVAAYTNGQQAVSEYDCLLLQHVLWNRPAEADRINDWLLAELTKDEGISQMKYLLHGEDCPSCGPA